MVDDGVSESAWRGLWLYAVDTGELTRISPDGMNCWEAAWCGTAAIVAVSSDSLGEDAWYDAVLTRIDVDTGTCRELLTSELQLGVVAGSPDGRYVGVVEAVCSDRGIMAGDLTIIDLVADRRTVIGTANTDVTCLQWIDDERLGYLGQRRLRSVAGIVDATTGKATEAFATEVSCGGMRYPDGAFTSDGRVVVVQSAWEVPMRTTSFPAWTPSSTGGPPTRGGSA